MKASKTYSWESKIGTVYVTITAERESKMVRKATSADGWEVEVDERVTINTTDITAKFGGKTVIGMWIPAGDAELNGRKHIGGQADALSFSDPSHYYAIKALYAEVVAEAEADQTWIDYQAIVANAEKDEREYAAHAKGVDSMMTLGGRTY